MFKAKLINNSHYYKLRNKRTILTLVPVIPIGLLANFYAFPWWLTVFVIVSYILTIYLIFRNQKAMDSMIGQQSIEINTEEITIKSKNGTVEKRYEVEHLEKVFLQKEYNLDQETMQDIKNEISGNSKQNFLIIQSNAKKNKFSFELDSHYMLNQLLKIIHHWESNKLKIERLS